MSSPGDSRRGAASAFVEIIAHLIVSKELSLNISTLCQVVIGEVYDMYCMGFGCVRVQVTRGFPQPP